MKMIALILAGMITFSLAAEEAQKIVPLKTYLFEDSPAKDSLEQFTLPRETRVFYYYSQVAILPGPGVSIRSKKGKIGSSLDFRVVLFPGVWYAGITADWNGYYYFQKNAPESLYVSGGVGAISSIGAINSKGFPLWPYIPLRFGYQSSFWMADVGVLATYSFKPVPIPECRVGISF